ncbi:MAG: nucleotidyltransferase [Flavobacteriales bacterium]|nr:nucleotidyltransferase [Flavobacteriales bacterium]
MLTENWTKSIEEFISEANRQEVEMIMVGGGAVNFHGYQRHSADVDFWINPTSQNFDKLLVVFQNLKYEINEFPQSVMDGKQNISLKFSTVQIEIELITRFSINKTFKEAFSESEIVELKDNQKVFRWRVLSLDDLIMSKIKSGRPKDLLDIQELKKINQI